ncbi:MAG: class I SAM-dependent methyltransferase [Anaerolineaceae bacterium]|nr:class I SAM-dependent methyltransferase [Anaerolineaceae bacterium]
MSEFTDRNYLQKKQYRDSSKLNVCAALHAKFSTSTVSLFEWVFDQLDLQPGSCVLGLGCGPGGLWIENATRIPQGCSIIVSDFSPGMVHEAQANLRDCYAGFEFQVIDAQAIPCKDETFDMVTANHMLYHVPHRRRALKEIARVLKTGGVLYATTTGEGHLWEIDELLGYFDRDSSWLSEQLGFSLENGARQLEECFSDVQLTRFHDALAVTEVGPLLDYVFSMCGSNRYSERLAEITRKIKDEIRKVGAFHIRKDVGIFVAKK